MKTYEINKNERTPDVIDSLTCVWEESVRASHTFLTESDIANLKPFVREALAGIESLVVAHNGSTYTAFIGIQGNKIEMLFVSPAHFGEGIGKHLTNMAIQKYKTTHVDVNEQPPRQQASTSILASRRSGVTIRTTKGTPSRYFG